MMGSFLAFSLTSVLDPATLTVDPPSPHIDDADVDSLFRKVFYITINY